MPAKQSTKFCFDVFVRVRQKAQTKVKKTKNCPDFSWQSAPRRSLIPSFTQESSQSSWLNSRPNINREILFSQGRADSWNVWGDNLTRIVLRSWGRKRARKHWEFRAKLEPSVHQEVKEQTVRESLLTPQKK